jgi:hypothetical protein
MKGISGERSPDLEGRVMHRQKMELVSTLDPFEPL